MKAYGGKAVLLTAALVLAALPVMACGETVEITLPDGVHHLSIPGGMTAQEPSLEETDLRGIYLMPPDLELLIFSYDISEGTTAQTLAEALAGAGMQAEVRRIADTDFLVFQDQDDADGAYCVGYSYLTESQMIELSFFYGSQSAMDWTWTIMESFH